MKLSKRSRNRLLRPPSWCVVDYEKAKLVSRHHRLENDEGLVVVAVVDSSMYGSLSDTGQSEASGSFWVVHLQRDRIQILAA